MVLTNGITTSNFFWKYLHRRWAPGHTLINWDLKGHGHSGPARSPEGASIPALAERMSPRVFALSLRGVQRLVGSPVGFRLGRGLRMFGP